MATSTAKQKFSRAVVKKTGLLRTHQQSTVSRWGNSLGFRIPRDAVSRLKLKAGSRVSVEVRDGGITIKPMRARKKWTEAELLKGITPEMIGGEIDWGGPVGKEIW